VHARSVFSARRAPDLAHAVIMRRGRLQFTSSGAEKVLWFVTRMGKKLSFKEILNDLGKEEPDSEERPIMGWTCTYLPLEILDAGGLHGYRIIPESSAEQADAYLDPNFCPFIKASLGTAIEGGYSFLSGIVMLNTCDGMRRLYDAWHFYCSPSFCFLLDVPRIISSASVAYFRERLQELTEHIEHHFGVKITEDGLAQAIEEANHTRFLLRRLLSLKGKGNPPLREGDIVDILAEGWRNPRGIFNKALERLVGILEAETYTPFKGLRIMLTGSLLDGGSLIRMVEELGGEVVASDLCTGGRTLEEIPLSSDPLQSLSEAYLKKTPCARMYDTRRRVLHIEKEVDRARAQGVLYYALKFCDPYLYEAPAVEKALRHMGVPVLFIEGEYAGRVSGGTRTRVQAFLEMLERNAA
jgi:benzoyl-CoA reductase/2-hydroxyglutaryl-CoA dehydratase subunit BcrC/BadD/HgdB